MVQQCTYHTPVSNSTNCWKVLFVPNHPLSTSKKTIQDPFPTQQFGVAQNQQSAWSTKDLKTLFHVACSALTCVLCV
jgi:hypothetical protein